MAAMSEPVTLRCQLCGARVAELADGILWMRARHHGDYHLTGIDVAALAKLAAGEITPETVQPVSILSPRPTLAPEGRRNGAER